MDKNTQVPDEDDVTIACSVDSPDEETVLFGQGIFQHSTKTITQFMRDGGFHGGVQLDDSLAS